MSDTPRTDAVTISGYLGNTLAAGTYTPASFARQLERELSAQSSRERKLVEAARSVFAEKGSLLDALNKLSDAVQMYRGMYE